MHIHFQLVQQCDYIYQNKFFKCTYVHLCLFHSKLLQHVPVPFSNGLLTNNSTQRRHHQKSETGVSVAPKMDMCPTKILKKKKCVSLVASCTQLCELRSESDKLGPTRYRDIDSKRKTLTERFFRLLSHSIFCHGA